MKTAPCGSLFRMPSCGQKQSRTNAQHPTRLFSHFTTPQQFTKTLTDMIPYAEANYIVNRLAQADSTQERWHVRRIAVDAIERHSQPKAEIRCTPEALEAVIKRCSQGYVEKAWKV